MNVTRNTLNKDCFTVENNTVTYNGQKQTATVTSELQGIGEITVIYKQNGEVVENPKDAGTYDIFVSVTAGTKYNAVTELPLEQTLVINKRDITVTADSKDSEYGSTIKELTHTVSPENAVVEGDNHRAVHDPVIRNG